MKHFHLLCYFCLLCSTFLFFSACKPEKEVEVITPDDLTVSYNLYYDAKKDTTLAAVAFCNGVGCGGNAVFLSPGEAITFNGASLVSEDTLYVKRFKGFLPSGTFVWKTSDGRTFTNEIQMDPIAFSPDLNTINRNTDLQLIWIGKPVQFSEEIFLGTLTLANTDGFRIITETSGAQSLVVPFANLTNVKTGKRTIILDRRKLIPLQQGGRTGGQLFSLYRDFKEVTFQ